MERGWKGGTGYPESMMNLGAPLFFPNVLRVRVRVRVRSISGTYTKHRPTVRFKDPPATQEISNSIV